LLDEPLFSGEENGAKEASLYAIGLSDNTGRGEICMLVDPSSLNACSGIDDPGIVCSSGNRNLEGLISIHHKQVALSPTSTMKELTVLMISSLLPRNMDSYDENDVQLV
jgi:hypothetical protein